MITKEIVAYGRPMILSCDANCSKAWGRNSRPQRPNGAEVPDSELGIAPVDPGTYEGGHAKPKTEDERLNKWCFRECERSESIEL